MDYLLRSGTFIDLLSVVKQSLRAGVERYSLKELEKYHEYLREMDLRKLAGHKMAYELLLETNRVEDASAEDKEAIKIYNQDDCRSTKNLHHWLERLRQEIINAGEDIPRPPFREGDANEKITEHQFRIKPIFDDLMNGVPVDLLERNEEQQARFILANMLDWYRREEKSFWWEYFRLIELPNEELLDEKNAIGGLRFTGQRIPDKKSVIDTYHFPSQECDLSEGNTIKNREGKSAGKIVLLDFDQQILQLRKGQTIKDLHPDAIFSLERYPTNDKVESIIGLAEWVRQNGFNSGSRQYGAARDLLLRNKPGVGAPVNPQPDLISSAKDWALKLDGSVLPIQGPPGSGKSYTASKMIVELIAKKKKIGVTALSHKVITALLEKIHSAAIAAKRKVSMLQKTSDDEYDPEWDVSSSSSDVAESIRDYDVIAGTSFMWCLPAFTDSVDYLFVDEAGQLSLIDTLAIAHAAKNLVLLGDPQQLKQPQKGVHPEGTDVSALEHILNGNKTLSDDQGIFLSKTFRMHPSICSFDSELFYENKLSSINGLENQRIGGSSRFTGNGLFFAPVIHEGNSNCSVEEVEMVTEIVNELCNGKNYWINKDNKKVKLIKDHIKIITPYNAQVSELSKRIEGVAIGTVDKFQGQEAPVIIFSMATSTPQDAPRGMDFLYSPNRFNVAVSRARAVFIMVANPALFEAECKTPGQIKLVNAFCRFVEVAKTAASL